MKRLQYFILLLCLSIMMIGCTKKQELEPISNSTPLLLKVTKEGTKPTLYLFGSIHAADESMYPLPSYVMDAYQKSEIIAVEFDTIEYGKNISNQFEFLSKFVNRDGKKIKDNLEKNVYENGVEILKQAGLYSSLLENYEPIIWQTLIENVVILNSNLSEEYGLDHYFLNRSKEDEKKILELESAEYQYNILLGFDYDTQLYLLKESINKYQELETNMKELYTLYQKGKQEELEKIVFEDNSETNPYIVEYNHKLITTRNKKMSESLEQSLEEGHNIFCTVGLAHIIGEGGIADLLEQKGYTITIIK